MTTLSGTRGLPPFGLLAIVLAAVAMILQFSTTLNHDAAWHYQTAFMWLAGGEIGKDIVDFNPPMTLWISTLPALVTSTTGWSPGMVFKAFSFGLLLTSLGLCIQILRHHFEMTSLCVFASCFAAVMLFYPAYHFGQREHLSVALVLPYLLFSSFPHESSSRSLAVAIGVLAAVGIGIKPYFVFVPIFVELILMISRRSVWSVFRPISLIVAGSLFAYVLLVWWIGPRYLDEVLPKAFWSYGAFEAPGQPMAFILKGLGLMGLCAIGFLLHKDRKLPIAFWIVASAAIAYGLAAFLQNKRWTYQWMPYMMLAMLCVSLLAMKPAQSRMLPLIATFFVVWYSATSAAPYFVAELWKSPPEGQGATTQQRVKELTEIFSRKAGRGEYVYGFSTSPRDLHPAVLESGAQWADSAGVLIFTPSLLVLGTDKMLAEHVEEVERQERMIIANLQARKPKVIVVQLNSRLAIPDDAQAYVDYYSKYSEFRELWRDYEADSTVGTFQVWVRKG